jgi:hypothetical protein
MFFHKIPRVFLYFFGSFMLHILRRSITFGFFSGTNNNGFGADRFFAGRSFGIIISYYKVGALFDKLTSRRA